jgi:L-amino acid N-acyltransferase YncA
MDTVAQALSAVWNATIAERTNVRRAVRADVPVITTIVNEAIAARAAFDERPKSLADLERWFAEHDDRYVVLVSVDEKGTVVGCASLNRYQAPHDIYGGVADVTCFLASGAQHRGLGSRLLAELETAARHNNFHKLVARTFPANRSSRRLLRKFAFRVVGVYKRDAVVDGDYVDVMILEKLLSPGRYKVSAPGDIELIRNS